MLGAMLAFMATACFGAWGLLVAARAARSSPAGGMETRAALRVRWTAVLVVAPLLLSLVEAIPFYGVETGAADDIWVHARAWAGVVNNAFNCVQVAFLSDLVGPRWLRRLAVEAFKSINSFNVEELQRTLTKPRSHGFDAAT
ncbi:unnamed protein product [Prorocentrum cordatum]|uniref:Uncharacterized protein n=1 Tax=Prorocentrum cordatum TaxID=2364126 RepID=A0ABN9PJL8_9DINO|nr:unnamed protein product [Polarella glacialis]